MVILKCNSLKIQIYKKMSLSTLTYYGFEIEYRNRLNHRVSGFFQRHPIGRILEPHTQKNRIAFTDNPVHYQNLLKITLQV